jgi:coproporphyrinogen III oxidase
MTCSPIWQQIWRYQGDRRRHSKRLNQNTPQENLMTKQHPSTPIDAERCLSRRVEVEAWFTNLRDRICAELEQIEDDYAVAHPDAAHPDGKVGRFNRRQWARRDEGGKSEDKSGENKGGGVMSIMHGAVFEKVGVNISTVFGEFSPEFRGQIQGTEDNPEFWASGLSLVAHPSNPFVPAVHINTRYLNTGGAGGKRWFGGGADLTPIMPNDEDVADFHHSLKTMCDRHNPDYYPKYKAWCDDYFYLKHRDEPRGAGGIFYDDLDGGDFEGEFAFTRALGEAFLDIYPVLVRRRMGTPFSESDRHHQLVRRGRYVEFNLLYDRGTGFGLKTGGNVEAILMSMPPEVRWP